MYEIQRLLCAKPTFQRRHTEQSSLSRGLFAWRFPVIHLSSKPASRLFPFTLMSFSPSKKPSFLKNFFFRDESKELFSITISTLRVTTLNSPMPRGMSLTNCGREMIRRQPVTVTGAPVVALAGGASVRGSETILGGSLGACFHRSRLSVAYLTAYSSLHSLSFCKHKNSAVWAVCQPFLETPAIFPRRNWQNTTEGRDL